MNYYFHDTRLRLTTKMEFKRDHAFDKYGGGIYEMHHFKAGGHPWYSDWFKGIWDVTRGTFVSWEQPARFESTDTTRSRGFRILHSNDPDELDGGFMDCVKCQARAFPVDGEKDAWHISGEIQCHIAKAGSVPRFDYGGKPVPFEDSDFPVGQLGHDMILRRSTWFSNKIRAEHCLYGEYANAIAVAKYEEKLREFGKWDEV